MQEYGCSAVDKAVEIQICPLSYLVNLHLIAQEALAGKSGAKVLS